MYSDREAKPLRSSIFLRCFGFMLMLTGRAVADLYAFGMTGGLQPSLITNRIDWTDLEKKWGTPRKSVGGRCRKSAAPYSGGCEHIL